MGKVLRGLPPGVRQLVGWGLRRRVANQLHGHGMGRHPPERIWDFGRRDLDAVAALVEERPFLMGEELCSYDLAVFSVVAAVIWTPFDNPLVRHGRGLEVLDAYCRRLWERLLPDRPLPPGGGEGMVLLRSWKVPTMICRYPFVASSITM